MPKSATHRTQRIAEDHREFALPLSAFRRLFFFFTIRLSVFISEKREGAVQSKSAGPGKADTPQTPIFRIETMNLTFELPMASIDGE